MKLLIDNLDARDYTPFLRGGSNPVVRRKLNQPDQLEATLLSEPQNILLPVPGARVQVVRNDGTKLFTGYLARPLEGACVGETERGPWLSYKLTAVGDEHLLDRRPLPPRPSYVQIGAGELLQDLAQELCPGSLDFSGVGDVGTLTEVACGGTRFWSEIAQEVAAQTRSAYRTHDHALVLKPVGRTVHVLDEADANLDARSLQIGPGGSVVNRATVLGGNEPASFVKDQFCGDGYALSFSLSNFPFVRTPHTVLEEEFAGSLPQHLWEVQDTVRTLRVEDGKLVVAGGTGVPADCRATLRQSIELGGAWQFQHGEVSIESGNGWVGGLFDGSVDSSHCIAGFRIMDSGGVRRIQSMVSGALAGTTVNIRTDCRYALSTRIYASEPYRLHPEFHSADGVIGGEASAASVRVVLECREIDPANPASFATPATVLFDDVIASTPAVCRYVLLASEDLHASTNFARIRRMPEVLVRSALPGQPYRTRLVGGLSEGAECGISSSGNLYFYSANPPAPNEAIVVTYRTSAWAAGSATDAQSIAEQAHLGDDGLRASVAAIVAPRARTSEDCALSAKTWLANAFDGGWSGKYECWAETLPNSGDIAPGDAVSVISPARAAELTLIVREVEIELADIAEERERIKFRFADDGADAVALQLTREQSGYEWPRVIVEADEPAPLPALGNAEFTSITSTTLTIDVGMDPPAAGGIEVRRSDTGWDPSIDRNLVGRFTTRTFTLPRLARNQQYCLRQYDASTPPRYSRHSAVLYVDKPL
jgi:hypothetical protein